MGPRAWTAAVVATGTLAVVPSAAARAPERYVSYQVRASGAVTVSWRGDEAGGCAKVGLCGYGGTIAYPIVGGQFEARIPAGRGRSPIVEFADLDVGNVVARTRRTARGDPDPCVDSPPIELAGLEPASGSGAGGAMTLQLGGANGVSLAGRCAGPSIDEVAAALPTATITRRVLRRGGEARMSGGSAFHSGPISGQVVSTLRLALHRQPPPRSTQSQPAPRRTRSLRIALVELSYRVVSAHGDVTAKFSGAPLPACRTVDACGAAGTETYSLNGAGSLNLTAVVPLEGARGRGIAAVIRSAVERRQLESNGELRRPSASVSASVTPGGGSTCTDSRRVTEAPQLNVQGASAGRLAVSLVDADADLGDLLRTRCPGPLQADVFGRSLSASVSIREMLGRRPTLRLIPGRTFESGGYTGSVRGGVTLALVRRTARIQVLVEHVR